jgi:hypothetical protein
MKSAPNAVTQRRIGMARQALLVALAASWSSPVSAFCFRPVLTTGASSSYSISSRNHETTSSDRRFGQQKSSPASFSWLLRSSSTDVSTSSSDTPVTLPEFGSVEEYTAYLETVAALPKGFATGTGAGKFISEEAPALGPLPIRGTVIYLPDGPTQSWAAVYTSNKVGFIFWPNQFECC